MTDFDGIAIITHVAAANTATTTILENDTAKKRDKAKRQSVLRVKRRVSGGSEPLWRAAAGSEGTG